jgi:hypothetical protein
VRRGWAVLAARGVLGMSPRWRETQSWLNVGGSKHQRHLRFIASMGCRVSSTRSGVVDSSDITRGVSRKSDGPLRRRCPPDVLTPASRAERACGDPDLALSRRTSNRRLGAGSAGFRSAMAKQASPAPRPALSRFVQRGHVGLDPRGDRSRSKGGVVRIIAPLRMTPSAEAEDAHDPAGAGGRTPTRWSFSRVAGR